MDKATNTGPVISHQAVKNIQSHVEDALARGAVDSTPENPTFKSLPSEGSFFAPRVLTNVSHDMRVMREETFGPVIPIMKVSSDDEAVKLMNDSDFGLTASVWTKDIKAGEALVERVEAGTVYINRCDYPSPVRVSFASRRRSCADHYTGPGLGWLEELWSGLLARSPGFRRILSVEEFPYPRDSWLIRLDILYRSIDEINIHTLIPATAVLISLFHK